MRIEPLDLTRGLPVSCLNKAFIEPATRGRRFSLFPTIKIRVCCRMLTWFLCNKTFQFPERKPEMGFFFFLLQLKRARSPRLVSLSWSAEPKHETEIKVCAGFEMLMLQTHNYFPCFHWFVHAQDMFVWATKQINRPVYQSLSEYYNIYSNSYGDL